MEAIDENQCLLVDGSNKVLDAITQNIPFKVVGLESVRLEQKSGYGQKLKINLDLLCQGLQLSPGIKSLSFRECIFDSAPIESAKCLGRLVRTHPTLETIKLGHTLYSEGFEYFFEGLKYNNTLKHLDATYIDVTEDAALALSESLRINTTLEELNMEGAKFGSFKALRYIVEAIGVNTSLKKLAISHIQNMVHNFDEEDHEDVAEPARKRQKTGQEENLSGKPDPRYIERIFCDSLVNNKTLTELKLTFSEIFPLFGEILTSNHTLTSLELEMCSVVLPNITIQELSDALKVNTTLRTLHLDECEDLADRWSSIHFEPLGSNSTLTDLGLGQSRMTENASEQLFNVLRNNTTLLALDLSGSITNEAQCQLLKDYLCQNNTLTKLDVFAMGSEDAHMVLEALKINTSLRALDFGANLLDEAVCNDFSATLQQNTTLQYLRIPDCGINNIMAKSLSQGLKNNKSLTTLDMSGNLIGRSGMKWICESLLHHPALTTFTYSTNEYDTEGAIGALLSVNTILEKLVLDGAKNITATMHLCNGLKASTSLRSLENRQYCDKPHIEIEACKNLLIDALQVNESVTAYEGYDVRLVDGIEPLISKNERLRRERINNALVLGHNILRAHKRGDPIGFPIEVWTQIYYYLRYPGIKFSFAKMLSAVVNKYK